VSITKHGKMNNINIHTTISRVDLGTSRNLKCIYIKASKAALHDELQKVKIGYEKWVTVNREVLIE